MTKIYDRLKSVHKRPLHEAQIKMAKAFFVDKKKIIMSQWGRSAGKSETILFISWVFAQLNPDSEVYIICPQIKQGRKIYWTSHRLQRYGPPEWVSMNQATDMRVEFLNGSRIIVDGCENFESLRGIKPNLVFYDEFQNHSKEFDLEVMRPNLLVKKARLIVTGTPPKRRSAYYVEFRENLLAEIASGDETRAYFEFSSYVNPAHDKEELDKIIAQLTRSGNKTIAKREYMGELCFGGEDSVFPSWSRTKHLMPESVMVGALRGQAHRLRFYTIFDPGTSSVFAVLFIAYNPNTQQVWILDEIYEKDRLKIDTKNIFDRSLAREQQILEKLCAKGHSFKRVYDEAAQWFAREVQSNYRIALTPTTKRTRDDESDIALIRMMMAEDNTLFVNEKCRWLVWEIESYCTDEKGQYPKENDHLLDDFRYFVAHVNFKFIADISKDEMGTRGQLVQVDGRNIRLYQSDNWGQDTWEGSLEDGYDTRYN